MPFKVIKLQFCSLGWKFESRKTRRSPFDFHILLILKFKILWNYRLEFFKKNSVDTILSKFGFLVKLIWCMYDQSGSCPINWKKIPAQLRLLFSCTLMNFLIFDPKKPPFHDHHEFMTKISVLVKKSQLEQRAQFPISKCSSKQKKYMNLFWKREKPPKILWLHEYGFCYFSTILIFPGTKKNKLSNFFAGCVFPVLWDGKNTKSKDFTHLSKSLFDNSSCWIYSVFEKIHQNN